MPVLPTIQYTPQQGLSPLETSGLKEVTSGVSDALQQIPKSMQRDRLQSSIDSANELFNETIEENIEGLPEPQQKKIRTAWRVNSAEFANLRNKENLTSDIVAQETARLFNPILDNAIKAKENYELQTTEDVRATGIELGKSPKEVEVEVARRGLVDAGNVAEIAMEEASKSSDGKIEWQRLVELTKDKNRAVLSDPNIMTLVRDIPDPLKKAQMEYYKAKAGAERAKKQVGLTGYTDVVKNMLPLAKYYRDATGDIVSKKKQILDRVMSLANYTQKPGAVNIFGFSKVPEGDLSKVDTKDIKAFFGKKVSQDKQKQFNQALKAYRELDKQISAIGINPADEILNEAAKAIGQNMGVQLTDADFRKSIGSTFNTPEQARAYKSLTEKIFMPIERGMPFDKVVAGAQRMLADAGITNEKEQLRLIIEAIKEKQFVSKMKSDLLSPPKETR